MDHEHERSNMMDANDQGHRYGNFPNYYAFHPPDNRLRVLERAKISIYIRDGLASSSASAAKSSGGRAVVIDDAADDAASASSSARKKPRHQPPEGRGRQKTARSRTGRGDVIYYCDAGCNAGELTMAMARSLAEECASDDEGGGEGEEDKGGVTSTDSTDDVSEGKIRVQCLGLDLDPALIERAAAKFSTDAPPSPSPHASCVVDDEKSTSENTKGTRRGGTRAAFEVCDLCSESEHNGACSSFFAGGGIVAGGNDDGDDGRRPDRAPRPLFHLTTIFSTTMWIHVHGGDDGLREFLERACGWTRRYLLIEPQPSGW